MTNYRQSLAMKMLDWYEANDICGFCHKELHTPQDKEYGIHATCEDASIEAYESRMDNASID